MENLFTWKRCSFLLVGLLIAGILWPSTRSVYNEFGLPTSSAGSNNPSNIPLDPHGDIIDILTPSQCASTFTGLYDEIDRTISHFSSSNTTIRPQDVDIAWRHGLDWRAGGALRILIHDNQLRILETREVIGSLGYEGRGLPLLYMLQRAVDSATAGGERLPTIEASIVLEDVSDPPAESSHSFWTFARNIHRESHERLWLVPNFDFYVQSEGAFSEIRRRGIARDMPFLSKIQQMVWRGQSWVNPSLRGSLISTGADKPWADFKDTQTSHESWLKPDDLCKYAMTVHTEGVSYSGRLGSLLLCNSLTFIHDLEWSAHFYPLLQPHGAGQNYVPVHRNWTDLEDKVQYYLSHPAEAERIIEKAVETFRSKALLRAGTSCYLRNLIQGYSTVAFEPEVFRPVRSGQIARRRGLSFEEFISLRHDLHDENKDLVEVLEDINAGRD
jgi:hypothetical protein